MNPSQQLDHSTNASVASSSRDTVFIVIESSIFIILELTAFVGNLLVCVAFYRNPSLRTITNIFIISLALTDQLMAVLVIPLATTSSIANKWIAGDYGCQIYGFSSSILGGTSLLTMMLLAINRYFRVVRPIRLYRTIYSKKRSVTMAVCAWIVTAVVSGVGFPVGGIRFQTYLINPTWCFPFFPSTSTFIIFNVIHTLYLVIASVVIAVCYVKIYQTIRQHNTAVVPSLQGGHSAYGVDEAKMIKLLTVVLTGFYLCWLPVIITAILNFFPVMGDTALKYHSFYYTIPVFASSVINPIIYATMSRPFRTEFLKILRGH